MDHSGTLESTVRRWTTGLEGFLRSSFGGVSGVVYRTGTGFRDVPD